MRTSLAYGRRRFEVEIPDDRIVTMQRSPRGEPLTDMTAALLNALENPFEFPPLRRALTPDDHITIVVDERLPQLVALLVPLLGYLQQAGIHADAVTLLCLPPSTGQAWLEDLPESFQDVQVEVHQPADRKKVSYLAATRDGKRVYLNRTAVDADQLIILAQRTFDTVMGYGGGVGVVYPLLGDEATLQGLASHLSRERPDQHVWPLQQQAVEVCWLLGSPFFIQVIAGSEGTLQHVMAGPAASVKEGERLLEATWHIEANRDADLVLAGVNGQRDDLAFGDLSRAFLAASRIVKPGGQVVVLSDLDPVLGREAQLMQGSKDPVKAFQSILRERVGDLQGAYAWTSAADQAKLHLLSRAGAGKMKDLFVRPLEGENQIRAMVAAASSVALLPDANQAMAVVRSGG